MSTPAAKSAPITRYVIVVAGVLLIAAVLNPAWNGFAPASPWILSMNRLGQAHKVMVKFHDSQNRWPETHRSLVDFAQRSEGQFPMFVHPAEKSEHDWLLLTPTETASTMDGEPRILLAAPLPGGFLPQDSNKRLVLFENGKTDWIPESDFERLANDNPPAR